MNAGMTFASTTGASCGSLQIKSALKKRVDQLVTVVSKDCFDAVKALN